MVQKGDQKALRTEAQFDPSAAALHTRDPSHNRLPRDHPVRLSRHVVSLQEEGVFLTGQDPVDAKQFCFRMEESHHISRFRQAGEYRRYGDYIAIPDERGHAVSAGAESEGQSLRMHGLHQLNQGFSGKGETAFLQGGAMIFTRRSLRQAFSF
jgi:hypothetical protein